MKHENLMLGGLFLACLLSCTLVLTAMLRTPLGAPQVVDTGTVAGTATLAVAMPCALPPDGVICPRLPG